MSVVEPSPRRCARCAGPSALGGDPQRFWTLTWTLAVLEFRLKFFGSVLGYFWQLMRPLLLFGVLYFVFTELVRLGGGVKDYPVILLMGIIIYTFYRGGDGHLGRLGARPRVAGAQGALPAAGDPAVGGADDVPELRPQLRRR